MFNLLSKLGGFADAKQMKDLMEKGAVILDVRSPGEFAGGHHPKAKNIPVDQIGSKAQEIVGWKKPVIVCCAAGARAGSAMSVLKNAGLEEIVNAGPWTAVPR